MGRRETECSWVAVHLPEYSLPRMPLLGPRFPEAQVRAFSPENALTWASGNRVLGGTVHLPEHFLPSTLARTFGGPSARGLPCAAPSTLVRIFREPSARGLPCAAPSTLSRNLALLIVGGLGCSGVTGHLPEHFFPGTRIPWIIGVLGYSGATDRVKVHLGPLSGVWLIDDKTIKELTCFASIEQV